MCERKTEMQAGTTLFCWRSAANVDYVMIEIDGSECTRRGWGGNGEIITMARTNVCGDNQKWINTFLMRGPGKQNLFIV